MTKTVKPWQHDEDLQMVTVGYFAVLVNDGRVAQRIAKGYLQMLAKLGFEIVKKRKKRC